jgi:hypothetical protein
MTSPLARIALDRMLAAVQGSRFDRLTMSGALRPLALSVSKSERP